MCPWQAGKAGKAGLPSPSLPCLLAFLLGSEGGALCWGVWSSTPCPPGQSHAVPAPLGLGCFDCDYWLCERGLLFYNLAYYFNKSYRSHTCCLSHTEASRVLVVR